MSQVLMPNEIRRRSRITAPTRATDWDSYYQRPYKTSSVTRKFSAANLVRRFRRFAVPNPTLVELGGANSCFLDKICAEIKPRRYHVVDTNRLGLTRLHERIGRRDDVVMHEQNVLKLDLSLQVDLVYSVGLIEHFGPNDTARAIASHFSLLKPGGIALITFPTPTWLYRLTRGIAEKTGNWIFHDERPLGFAEVEAAAAQHGTLLHKQILWPLVLTQGVGVWRKAG
jgi:SAM-dependent methyltransferase